MAKPWSEEDAKAELTKNLNAVGLSAPSSLSVRKSRRAKSDLIGWTQTPEPNHPEITDRDRAYLTTYLTLSDPERLPGRGIELQGEKFLVPDLAVLKIFSAKKIITLEEDKETFAVNQSLASDYLLDIIDKDDVQRYFSAVPDWKGFDFAFNPMPVAGSYPSGNIPVTKLSSWRDLPELLEGEFFNYPDIEWVFRGQRRFDWTLSPTLGRHDKRGFATQELADAQIERFRKAVRGRVTDHSVVEEAESDELWAVGQHYGLHTPLLDWTHSPYVALFFAFFGADVEYESNNPYRVIYALNKTYLNTHKEFDELRIIEPRKDDHGRLVNQAGLFIHTPYGESIEDKIINIVLENAETDDEESVLEVANHICKIYIPNSADDRSACLRHLRQMNVHPASLFPDLIGASEYCNAILAEEVVRKNDPRDRELEELLTDKEADMEASSLPQPESEADEIIATRETPILPQEPDSVFSRRADEDRYTFLARMLEDCSPGTPEDVLYGLVKSLDTEIRKNLVVDWQTRESAQAALRNAIRKTLRKHGYPPSIRDMVISAILEGLA
jgi:hypothetical protein